MWEKANLKDFEEIVSMCAELYREDPSSHKVTTATIQKTLTALDQNPSKGFPVVLRSQDQIKGYALLISFWSNELGGQICVIDELYVKPDSRNKGHAKALIQSLASKSSSLWPGELACVELEVTPDNARARKLYSNLGFKFVRNSMMRL